ncbi:MAG: phosphatase PAP2 family protein [Lysobacteraceae bacterium]|nr:MAG: phosphatase PAP2 family protein [Xanthomonadaceae bacterium]
MVALLREELRFGVDFLRRRLLRLSLIFVGLLLPLWAFAELADEVREREPFPFDEPILRFAHDLAGDGFDKIFLFFSAVGYQYGVVPFDIALIALLAWKRRLREGLFAGVAIIGSALLNLATKQVFARDRPSLWDSIAPEDNFSFPSGHAMGSATVAWVLLLLTWRTPWRWPVAVAMLGFMWMVGLSRVYLGVHYPSDILAGWAAASVWAVAVYLLVFRNGHRPWRSPVSIP